MHPSRQQFERDGVGPAEGDHHGVGAVDDGAEHLVGITAHGPCGERGLQIEHHQVVVVLSEAVDDLRPAECERGRQAVSCQRSREPPGSVGVRTRKENFAS